MVASDSGILHKDALGALDPSFLRENAVLVTSYGSLNWNNIDSLNQLLKAIEQTLVAYPTPNEKIKQAIELIFQQILARHPLLFGYWKRFTAVEYQFHDVAASLKVLEDGTTNFPHSVDLWCDYLRVLIVNYPNEAELIREKMGQARRLVGWQFYSHPFWDLLIDCKTKQNEDLISVYAELITIPLHQYAKYIEPYKELLILQNRKNELPNVDMAARKNQALVMEIWKFEGKLKQTFFNMSNPPTEEVKIWREYLKFLISGEKPTKLIDATFERCLVPCCENEDIWVMYIEWFSKQNSICDQPHFGALCDIYTRGCRFLSTKCRRFRLIFVGLLERCLTQGRDNKSKVLNVLKIVDDTFKQLLELWPTRRDQDKLMKRYLRNLKRSQYYSSIDQSPKEILAKQTAYAKMLDDSVNNFLSQKIDGSIALQCMMNEINLPTVAVELIEVNWLVLKSTLQTRKLFNYFSKLPSIRRSPGFWWTYYKFEKSTRNYSKLNKFIGELGSKIFLPTSEVNRIIRDYRTFYLLSSNLNIYHGIKTKTTAQRIPTPETQQSQIDPVCEIQFKINDPKWVPMSNLDGKASQDNSEWYKSRAFKENGHVGILTDKPQIVNTIIRNDSKSFQNTAPDIPYFRNLEKINQPPRINDHFTDEFLGSGTQKR